MDRKVSSTLGKWTAGVVVYVIVFGLLWNIQSTLNSMQLCLDEIHRDMKEFRERMARVETKPINDLKVPHPPAQLPKPM